MVINDRRTNSEIAAELGRRARQYRLSAMKPVLTQRALAREAGVAEPTVRRLEAGGNATLLSLIAVLRQLGLLANLEQVIPDRLELSPMERLALEKPPRQRASAPRKAGGKSKSNG